MGIPFDLKLDTSNDLTLTDGDLTLTTTKSELCVQTLGITLKTYQGEWFLDTSFGVPYLQEIIGVARKKDTVDKIFLSYISDNEYVTSVNDYSSSYDRDERYYTATFNITVDEETVSSTFNTRPSQEYYYPTPSTSSSSTCSKYDIEPYADDLFYFENISGLPENTYATWWNEWGNTSSEVNYTLITQSGEFILTADEEYILTRN